MRTQTQALHDARPESFDQSVGARDQLKRSFLSGIRLQVQRYRTLAAHQHVVPALALQAEVAGRGPVDHQHVGAHVSEQHAGERTRADRFEFQNPDAGEGTHFRG